MDFAVNCTKWTTLPRDPKGEKRPADIIGTAVMVARIATGEITEAPKKESAAAQLGRAGGKARAAKLTPQKRRQIAKAGAAKRWKKET